MELKIYNQNDELKLTVEPSDNSTRQKSIQADHVLSLSFTSFEFVRLDVNDYVEFLGQRFWIIEQYIPKQVSTVEWEYNCRFYGPENLIGQALVLKIVDGEDDPVFSLTAPAQVHVELVVENLNRQMGTTDWKVGEVIAQRAAEKGRGRTPTRRAASSGSPRTSSPASASASSSTF